MKSFKNFIIESNELARIQNKEVPPHHSHPMGQFLQFMRNELPGIQLEDSAAHTAYKKELQSYLDTLMGEDPKHFNALHKELTTDEEDGSRKRADLYDVLLTVATEAGNRAYNKVTHPHSPEDSDTHFWNIVNAKEAVRKIIDEKTTAMIRERTKNNPKFRHIEYPTDIEI